MLLFWNVAAMGPAFRPRGRQMARVETRGHFAKARLVAHERRVALVLPTDQNTRLNER